MPDAKGLLGLKLTPSTQSQVETSGCYSPFNAPLNQRLRHLKKNVLLLITNEPIFFFSQGHLFRFCLLSSKANEMKAKVCESPSPASLTLTLTMSVSWCNEGTNLATLRTVWCLQPLIHCWKSKCWPESESYESGLHSNRFLGGLQPPWWRLYVRWQP